MKKMKEQKAILLNFPDKHIHDSMMMIDSIGWETRRIKSSYNYQVDCTKDDRKCVLQYTTAGEGVIKIGNAKHLLPVGTAFILTKPGPYLYKISENAELWEFKYISLTLTCVQYWNSIINLYGHIITLDPECSAMKYWEMLYSLTLADRMTDIYQCSAFSYTFMMELRRSLIRQSANEKKADLVQRCISEIITYYQQPLDLQTIAVRLKVSPMYLLKVFKEGTGETPIAYLNTHRLKIACSFLESTSKKVNDIAYEVGITNANYFARVFKKKYGMTPIDYRRSEMRKQTYLKPQHINVDFE
ncbi:MAG: AraC family transcriptional regulator [Saccharofermentanales bacterium]